MATYSKREITSTVIEFEIPTEGPYGATYADMMKAVAGAIYSAGELGVSTEWDDWCSFHPGDESITIRFEKPGI